MSEAAKKKILLSDGNRLALPGRILLVDDEDQNLKLLKAILGKEGHEFFTARSGEEALQKASEMSPDLILLDVMMPGMDGYEVLSRLREKVPEQDIPVIMVTSLDDMDSRVRALEAGADDFVTKPVSRQVLTARVRSLLKVKAYHDTIKDRREHLEAEVARKTEGLKRYSRQLEILNQASASLNSFLDVSSILRAVVLAALDLWESDGAAAGLRENGRMLFKEWRWKGKSTAGEMRCDMLEDLEKVTGFMKVIRCRERNTCDPCRFEEATGGEIRDLLAVPINDQNLQVQACLLLFNPVRHLMDENDLTDHPLPGLISSAATALDNTRYVTELKEKEEALQSSLREKELLLKEIHHRVKNNLQAIVGLLEAHLGSIKDPKDRQVFLKGQSLAMSMSMIHELLYSSEDYAKVDFSDYTERLVRSSLDLYQGAGDRIQVSFDIDEIYLNTDTAVPVSLIINELVSNAMIHAFPGGREGEVSVSMRQIGGDEVQLVIGDNGVGIGDAEDDPDRQTLGLHLVQSLMENLNGSMEIKVSEGTCFTIRFKEYFECENLEL